MRALCSRLGERFRRLAQGRLPFSGNALFDTSRSRGRSQLIVGVATSSSVNSDAAIGGVRAGLQGTVRERRCGRLFDAPKCERALGLGLTSRDVAAERRRGGLSISELSEQSGVRPLGESAGDDLHRFALLSSLPISARSVARQVSGPATCSSRRRWTAERSCKETAVRELKSSICLLRSMLAVSTTNRSAATLSHLSCNSVTRWSAVTNSSKSSL